jgi:hypothetical protein
MTSINKAPDKLGQLLLVFQELLSGVPPDAATTGYCRTKNDDGTIVWLQPSNQRAARFSAHVEDNNFCLIDVSFGSETTFEFPTESYLADDATFEMMLEAVKAMGMSVIAGKCQERFGFLGIRGTIDVGRQRPLSMTSFLHPRLFPKVVRYQAYVQTTDAL